jgi:hypothetical protein
MSVSLRVHSRALFQQVPYGQTLKSLGGQISTEQYSSKTWAHRAKNRDIQTRLGLFELRIMKPHVQQTLMKRHDQ